MKDLAAVALGEQEADLVVRGVDLVNVYTREVLKGYSVATKGKWIAYVGPDASHTIGPGTKVIDGAGRALIPGFVDGHTHMLYYASPQEFLRYVMRGGTTTIITELMELTFPLGYKGILGYLDSLRDQPIKIFSTVPPSVTLSRHAAAKAPTLAQLLELLKRDDVLGVGEGFWQEVLRGERNFPALSAEARALGKTSEGHAAGCRGQRLAAYLNYGVSSCHESVSAEDVVERLRFGISTMIREGSIRKELEAIAKIKDLGLDLRRAVLVTDGADPRDLVEKGYLEHVVQRAIDAGFDPVLAVQMASLNVAEHFRLDGVLGGIAPAKYADMVLIPDLRTIKAEVVISNGVVIAQDGKLLVEPRPAVFRGNELKTIHLSTNDCVIRVPKKEVSRLIPPHANARRQEFLRGLGAMMPDECGHLLGHIPVIILVAPRAIGGVRIPVCPGLRIQAVYREYFDLAAFDQRMAGSDHAKIFKFVKSTGLGRENNHRLAIITIYFQLHLVSQIRAEPLMIFDLHNPLSV